MPDSPDLPPNQRGEEGLARSGSRKMVSFKEEEDGRSWGADGLLGGRHCSGEDKRGGGRGDGKNSRGGVEEDVKGEKRVEGWNGK